MKKLSIIIPAYNAEPYIHELLSRLNEQITDAVEVIVVDDGSKEPFKTDYEWCKVIRQKNGGASKARNTGIENANGEYIAFIDADDMVSEVYVSNVLGKIESEAPDYIYLSWRTMSGGWTCDVKLNSVLDEFPPYNLCVWNRVYKKDLIGNVRFNEKKKIAEDAEFIRKVEVVGKKKAFISDYMYFYRSTTPNSLTKRFANGELETERVVYYFRHVTRDMDYLIEEFKQTDKDAEIILLTDQLDIPELKNYAMVMKPCYTKATKKRGEQTSLIEVIERPKKTQLAIYTASTGEIGGIETFIYALCQKLNEYYDITVLYESIADGQLDRLEDIVECIRLTPNKRIVCDTLLINRITDSIPKNVSAKQTVQMVHGCYDGYTIPQDRDRIVCVSDVVKAFYGEQTKDADVIHNIIPSCETPEKPLLLVSTTRLTIEKGGERIVRLANLMNNQGVKFLWLCFTDGILPNGAPDNLVQMNPTLYADAVVRNANYLVQLSDSEGFGLSIVEALSYGTAVITTPIPVLSEIQCVENKNCYIVPFDFDDTFDTTVFRKRLHFGYTFDNPVPSIAKWRELLGNTKPNGGYDPNGLVHLRVIQDYTDLERNEDMKIGAEFYTRRKRAKRIVNAGCAEIIDG